MFIMMINLLRKRLYLKTNLVNLFLATTWYTYHSQFHQQTDGIAMGGPASSTSAEIYMQAHIYSTTPSKSFGTNC